MEISTEITIVGQTFSFTYPENLREVCNNGLNGVDYPILQIPGFQVDVIVDVGANVGSTSLYFLNKYPQARIFSFEPAQNTFEYLKRNTERFRNISCYNYALGDLNGTVLLHHGKEHCAQDSLFKSGIIGSQGEMVMMRRASEAFSELGIRRISILKLDTEGSETRILSDIYLVVPVEMVYLEYHSEEDRIDIDGLLQSDYLLGFSKSTKVHRGQVAYVSKSLYRQHLQSCSYRISTRESEREE